jgi:RNA-binding protein 23/39
MKTTSKDIKRYFKKKVGCSVKEVILLRDKRTNRHKGSAYVQFGRIEDVAKAVQASGQQPDFQRFPILVKASESEKNYTIPASSSTVTSKMMGGNTASNPVLDKDGRMIESQKVYVGSLDPSVTDQHLYALFSNFGQLEKVSMQMDPSTRQSRGYAFLSFRDPKEANLAIQTMSNQVLAGRPIKTGWASQTSSVPGVDIVTSDEFPDDAADRAQKAYSVLAQLMGTSVSSASVSTASASMSMTAEEALNAALGVPSAEQSASGSSVPTVAEARKNLSTPLGLAPTSNPGTANNVTVACSSQGSDENKIIGGQTEPTRNLLVHNMFDKSQETEAGWVKDLMQEFRDEGSKFGKVEDVVIMSAEEGGKIYVRFDKVEAAQRCASNFAGRWFDKRQLRVDFISDADMPSSKRDTNDRT